MADQPKKKVNRAKARLQRRAEEMEAQRREAAAEAATMPDLKAQEADLIKKKLAGLDLVEHNVCFDARLPTRLTSIDHCRRSLSLLCIC